MSGKGIDVISKAGELCHQFVSKYGMRPDAVFIGRKQHMQLIVVGNYALDGRNINTNTKLNGMQLNFVDAEDYVSVGLVIK